MSRQPAGSEESTHFPDRRSAHWRISEIGVLVMMLVQLAGLIWGAATLKSGVDNMGVLVSKLEISVTSVDIQQRKLEIEQARQAGRLDAMQGMIRDIQRQRAVP